MAAIMHDRRRNQRIRFAEPPAVRLGYAGASGTGYIENLSVAGLMVRTGLALEVGGTVGCEFSLQGNALIDLPLQVVSRVGNLYGGRFRKGPLSEALIEDAITSALAAGQASVLSLHESGGRRILRVLGGLCGALGNDFMHALTRVGVDELDLEGVTRTEHAGLALCRIAVEQHGVSLGPQSECFTRAWAAAASTLPVTR